MEFKYLDPDGPVILIPKIFRDARGYFMETFRENDFREHCGDYQFVQDNQSKSVQNVLRGLHFQYKRPQGKLVRAIAGAVLDVCVDLRKSSPFFGKSYQVKLDTENNKQLWVPPGFAHAFLVLSETAEFVYKCTAYYAPGDERTLLWNDPELGIAWPCKDPILSEKDLKGAPFKDCPYFE